ncbi:NB-ARC domain-containing protein, partial [Nocardia tengchongensis]|uniref:NB-ARC domain-containing protein n=1 Tax=Nocardia tengchongensis TaxID=2055889 RepID=UPI0036A90396
MTSEGGKEPIDTGVPAGQVVSQSASVSGTGNRITQAGRDVVEVTLPPEALTPVAEVDTPTGLANLPLLPARFVGRTAELDRLDQALAETQQVVVAAVHGLGGIGKSTLVAQWADTHAHGLTPIWWITAASPAAVEEGLADLAEALQPALVWRALAVEQLAERALQWLAAHDRWLLVLDNVADPHDIHAVLARTRHTSGRVIVTSRLAAGWQHAATVLQVDVLTPQESLELFTSILTTTTGSGARRDLDGAAEVCAALGHLPLAVEQAAAYLAQNPLTSPRAYLTLLSEYPAAMYARGAVATESERTVARVWQVSLDRIAATEPFAVQALAVLAWYAPDTIPASLLDGLADPPTVNAALGILAAYNMITPDPATGTIAIHRLVQAVTRTPGTHHTQTSLGQARNRATEALNTALPDRRDDPTTWPVWRALLPHAEALAGHTRPDTDTDTTAALLNKVALFLVDQGLPTRAIPLHERALTDRERVLGDDHPDTLASRNNLAGAYESAGRVSEGVRE